MALASRILSSERSCCKVQITNSVVSQNGPTHSFLIVDPPLASCTVGRGHYKVKQDSTLRIQHSRGSLGSLGYSFFEGPRKQVTSKNKKQGHQFVDILMTYFVCSRYFFRYRFSNYKFLNKRKNGKIINFFFLGPVKTGCFVYLLPRVLLPFSQATDREVVRFYAIQLR